MKKKLLIVMRNMIAGGIEKSCLSFIEHLKNDYDIDLFLFSKTGEFVEKIPNWVKVIEGTPKQEVLHRAETVCDLKTEPQESKVNLKTRIKKILKKVGLHKLKPLYLGKGLKQKYDVVISFNGMNMLASNWVIKRTRASKKFAIVHCDLSKIEYYKKQIKILSKFDKILCVSNSCKNKFVELQSKLKNKVDYLYNFSDIETIKQNAAKENIEFPKTFNIISVSRLSDEKAHDRTLKVLFKLKQEGYKFVWHIVGDGENKEKIQELIEKLNLGDCVKMHGYQSNPYPYIKAADILFLGSIHESWGLVLLEAMMLQIPVVTTKTCSAYELVGENGYVCENSEDGIYSTFKYILDNKNDLKQKRKQLENFVYDNDKIKEKFKSLCD